jgi:arylformamidase
MPAFDPDYLDRMYNNRARVPEHGAYFARWRDRSALVRQEEDCRLDLRYGEGPNESLDVFGTPTPRAPVLVFLHGGYWRSLDKSDHSFIAPAFTQQGVCVVIPNYALCPAVTIVEIVMQMVRALAWTWRHVAAYGGDPARISLVGHSAGGHLAAMLLTCLWPRVAGDLPPDLVKHALSISGLYDLEPIMHTPFLQADLRLTAAQVGPLSPVRLPAPRAARLCSVVGGLESEEFLRQNRLLRKAWGQAAVPVCEVLPGLDHFSVVDALADPGHRLHRLSLAMS